MSLPLGESTLSGLQQASTLESLPALISSVMHTAMTGESTDGARASGVAYKSAFGALLTLVLEAARSDAAPSDITPVLESAGWPSSGVSEVTSLFSTHKDALRGLASTSSTAAAPSSSPSSAAAALPLAALSSTSFPSVVGLDWRLDAYLRSDALDAVRAPSFLVSLQTQAAAGAGAGGAALGPDGKPITQSIPFSCNFQQLQDLLAKLKDAQKQIQQRVE